MNQSKRKKFEDITKDLIELWEKKNIRYDDSFSKSYSEYGLLMSCIRLEDKLLRFKALAKNKKFDDQKDESMIDTLKDLANYSIMTLIELTK